MKKTLLALFVAVASVIVAVGAPTMHPYELPASAGSRDQAMGCLKANEIVAAGGKLELGKWYTDWATCKQYADDNGLPMLAVWSNAKCVHCWYTDICFQNEKYKEWAATHDAGKVICCFMAGSDKSCPDQQGSAGYNWMWKGDAKGDVKLGGFPFVVLWWKEKGINYRVTGDAFCAYANGSTASLSESSVSDRIDNLTARMETQFAAWHPEPEVTYNGGWFTQTNYPYASLQAEATTKNVAVEIVRTSLVATNQTMTVSAPGKETATVTIDWELGQLAQTNVIANFSTAWFVRGEDVTLTLMDGDAVASTVTVACVEPENSAGNPKWIGRSFDFGEWTMDLDAAKAMVEQKGGSAYTLVSVQGSLWCPDCANVERNFLDAKDAEGNNRFAAWAKSRNIALVSVDIPNFSGPTESDFASPCLLSRTAYQSTLARAKEYPQSGADAALTNKMWRSGLGYLTRNEVSDEDAAKVFSRNHDLVKNNTYEGGFHRPEDGNANRTGVPIFVLLRKDGSVAARLTRMAAVSPMASEGAANFDNYIRRFEEMLAIADNNATEIENNYASASNRLTLKANGGSEDAQLSHADPVDVFRLDGVSGNALQSVVVSGSNAVDVTVSLVTTNAEGKAETLATKSGKLSDGIAVEETFAKAGSYFVEVKAADITSEAFRLESPGSTFQDYTLRGSVVLVPHEDKATARPTPGSDKLTVKLTAGTTYYITGMESCAALAAVPGAPAGFFVATQDGNAEMTLTQVDGEVSYQVWNAGSVGFVETTRTVAESVCDADGEPLEILVKRQGGKSGTVKMTVTVDTNATTLAAGRFWLVGTNAVGAVEVDWADGDVNAKKVRLYIDDTIAKGQYDGTTKVTLQAAVASQAGDVGLISGQDRFELTVVEDDSQDPGVAYFTRAEPTFTRTCMVYARASEGARLWAKRVDGSDGLVAGLLVSSVGGTDFTTEDPRDLETLESVLPGMSDLSPSLKGAKFLYWSSRESKEKYVQVTGIPAGTTAKVEFIPVGNLKGIAASNTVTIVSVADDAPGFVESTGEFELFRYVDYNPVEIGVTNLVRDGAVSFRKISGTLPAGVKVGFVRTGDTAGVMTLSGATTAKAGVYESAYRVSEKRGNGEVYGMAVRVTVTVLDPIMQGAPGVAEPNPELRKTRTFKDVPVVSEDGTRLLGLLQVTIPPTGRVSAKYSGIGGKASFSAKAWSGYSPTDTGWELQTLLASKTEAEMGFVAYSDGGFGANIKIAGGVAGVAESDGKLWSKSASATDWQGYYTVALRHSSVLSEDQEGLAPTGDGYLTLKMDTKSACDKGTFKIAGRLPNGTSFSGSAVLGLKGGEGVLPICKSSSKDMLTTLLGITAKAFGDGEKRRCVMSPAGCVGYWAHTERASLKGSYAVGFQACGSYYDEDEDLGGCCQEYYETTTLKFYVNGEVGGAIKVGSDTVGVQGENPNEIDLSLKRSTGVITGTFVHPQLNQVVSFMGVVVNGWGEGCGCGPGEGPFLPFMSGSYFLKNAGLWLGGAASIDK